MPYFEIVCAMVGAGVALYYAMDGEHLSARQRITVGGIGLALFAVFVFTL